MKKFILLITAIVAFNSLPQENFFTDISFIDFNNGWITTNYDTLLRTTDGGGNWEEVPFIDSKNIKDLFFIDKNIGFVSTNGNVLKTENGGLSWELFFNGDVSAIFFFNDNVGFLCSDTILKTTDAGITWNNVLDSITSSIWEINFTNEEIGFAHDGYDMYSTSNGGSSWEIYFSITRLPDGLIDIYSLDELNWFKSEYKADIVADGYFCSSVNAGIDWDCHYLQQWKYIRNIFFSSNDEGWSIFEELGNYSLQNTTDSGVSWQLKDLPLQNFLFINGETAWGYTLDGNIYRTDDGWVTSKQQYSIVTSIKESNYQTILGFSLSQNYPNPFNPSTTLSFVISHLSSVTLKVYDALGREIATLVNEEKPAGNYEVIFHADNLSSGIYFYALTAGEFKVIKKLTLLK